MDFETAYEKYVDGTASPEEKEYIEAELEKTRKLTELIDKVEIRNSIIAEPNIADVQRAQKSYKKKNALQILLISLLVFTLSVAIVCSAIFGVAFGSANKNLNYNQAQAETIAKQFVIDNYSSRGAIFVKECERDIHIETKLNASTYYYSIEVQNGTELEIELIVNAKTGLVTLEDVSST